MGWYVAAARLAAYALNSAGRLAVRYAAQALACRKYRVGAAAAASAAATVMPRVPGGVRGPRRRKPAAGASKRKASAPAAAPPAKRQRFGPLVRRRGPAVTLPSGNGAGEDLQVSTIKSGHKAAAGAIQKALVKASTRSTIYRHNQLSALPASSGCRWLSVCSGGVSGYDKFPLYVYDLTVPHNVNLSGTLANPTVCFQLAMSQSTAGVNWLSQLAYTSTGGTNGAYQLEVTPAAAGSIDNAPGKQSFMEWLSISVAAYGTTHHPTKYCVQLAHLTDPDLDPVSAAASINTTVAGAHHVLGFTGQALPEPSLGFDAVPGARQGV